MKQLLLSLGLLFATQTVQAQDFYHSIGVGYFGSVVRYAYSDAFENVDGFLIGSMPLVTYKAIPAGATVTKDVNHGFSIQFLYSLTD